MYVSLRIFVCMCICCACVYVHGKWTGFAFESLLSTVGNGRPNLSQSCLCVCNDTLGWCVCSDMLGWGVVCVCAGGRPFECS